MTGRSGNDGAGNGDDKTYRGLHPRHFPTTLAR